MARFRLGGLPSGLAAFAAFGEAVTARIAAKAGGGQAFQILASSTLTGTDFADTLLGGSGDEVLLGLDGIDRIFGGEGNDTAFGGTAADTLFGDSGGDTLFGDLGPDSLYGGDGDDSLYGGSAGERLFGGTGHDTLAGGSGNDSLTGNDGDDLLAGGPGSDRVFGGTGQDTLDYSQSGGGVAVILNDAGEEKGGDAEGDVIFTSEHIVGSNAGDTLVATAGAAVVNSLWGLDGDDTLNGLGGNDWLIGGGGLDSLVGDSGHDWIFGQDGNDVALGGDGNDTFDPGTGIDTVFGGTGNDYFLASPGADRYVDSDGNDVIDYALSPQAIALITSGNVASGFGGWASGDTFTGDNANNAVIGSDFDDTVTGYDVGDSAFANTFLGGLGDDTLMPGSSGFDTLIGGDGADWAGWQTLAAAVTVDLAGGSGIMGADTTALSEIENALGSQADDRLLGNAAVNALRGQAGDDYLDGGGRADSLFGEQGDDTIRFDAQDAEIIGGTGRDTLLGTSAADAIQLSQGKFEFAGSFAAFEVYELGGGNDYFLGADNADAFGQVLGAGITVYGGSGNDYVSMRGNDAAVGNADYIEAGSGNDYVWGGRGADTIYGGAGGDNTYGGIGSDTIFGGAGFDIHYIGRGEGNDTLVGGSGADADGLVLFWGNDALLTGSAYDGVDPSEIAIAYGVSSVTITYDSGGSVSFDKGAVSVINLFDFANGDAGNGPAPPPTTQRDIWSASWDSGSQTFTAFTLAVDG
jgi:Ca2+-binding RTX toxin-like protein